MWLSALKVLILWWVVVYDKYKTTLVSDPRDRIALIDFLRPESHRPVVSGFQDRRKSTRVIRWLGSDTRAVFLFYYTFPCRGKNLPPKFFLVPNAPPPGHPIDVLAPRLNALARTLDPAILIPLNNM
jgi:hypothetical protein